MKSNRFKVLILLGLVTVEGHRLDASTALRSRLENTNMIDINENELLDKHHD